jgi:hypothetical protein
MRSKAFLLITVLSVGFLLLGVVSVGTVAWCQIIGGCKFGKYEAKVTITDAKTQEPLSDRKMTANIDYGRLLFVNVEEGQTVTTDEEGQANIEFNRGFYSPLTITVFPKSLDARAQFAFSLRDIKEGTTLTQVKEEYIAFEEEKRKTIKLDLEVGNWSLGDAQQGVIEE